MSQRNCYALYFELAQLEAALLAIAAIASPDGEPIQVTLPSGRRIALPFTIDDQHKDCEIRAGRYGPWFNARLRFPIADDLEWIPPDVGDRVDDERIETDVNLIVLAGARYVELTFHSGYSVCATILRSSPTVQDQFRRVLDQAGGLAGLIYTGGDDFRRLDDPSRLLSFDYLKYDDLEPEDGGKGFDLDGCVTELLVEWDR